MKNGLFLHKELCNTCLFGDSYELFSWKN